MNATGLLYEVRHVGVCTYASPTFAKIRPHFRQVGGSWVKIANPKADYPPEGNVFCPSFGKRNASDKDLWEFSVTPNTVAQSSSGNGDGRPKDQTVAVDVTALRHVVDLSDCSLEEARQSLVEVGIKVEAELAGPVLIKFVDGLWTSLELSREKDGRWKPVLKTNLEAVPLHRAQGPTETLVWEGVSYVCSAFSLGGEVRQVDWSPDDQFLRELPKKLKKLLGQSADLQSSGFPHVINDSQLAPYFRSAEMLPTHKKEMLAFKERLGSFLLETKKVVSVANQVFDEIRGQPAIVAMVEAEAARLCGEAKAEIRRTTEAEVRTSWEREHSDLVRKKEAAAAGAVEAETQNRAAIARLSDTKRKLETVERAIVGQVDGLREVLERAPKVQSERVKAIGRQVERALGLGRENTLVPSELPPWSSGKPADAVDVGLGGLQEALLKSARCYGLEHVELKSFDALVRAGEAVLLGGPDRNVLVAAYADAVAGGQVRRMPLDIGIIGADDLWRQPGTGQPTAFAHAWVAARANPDSPFIVVLDEVQAASGWSWLLALSSMLSDAARPKNLLLAMSVGPMPSESVGSFRAIVEAMPRTSPTMAKSALLSVALTRMGAKSRPQSLLRGLADRTPVGLEESSQFAAEVLAPLSSVHHATRVADAFVSARAAMSFDEAAALCTDFAGFLSGASATDNIFVSSAARFDQVFAPRGGSSGSSGGTHA